MEINNKNNKGLVCHVHGDLVLVKILYCLSHKTIQSLHKKFIYKFLPAKVKSAQNIILV